MHVLVSSELSWLHDLNNFKTTQCVKCLTNTGVKLSTREQGLGTKNLAIPQYNPI